MKVRQERPERLSGKRFSCAYLRSRADFCQYWNAVTSLPRPVYLLYRRSFYRNDHEVARKMDNADRARPVCIANVYTSKARARDFCEHTARRNSSRPARSADKCDPRSRFSDETLIDN